LHTLTETMYAFATTVVRLKCTFHDYCVLHLLVGSK
jgi:hypothetical protein